MLIKTLYRELSKRILGTLKYAQKHGMICGVNCTAMSGVSFGSEPYLITLGDRVRMSTDVLFVTHDGGTWAFRREPDKNGIVRFGKINVGDDTFIGARSIIMPGVTIGKNCVIGAGSVVTKDVPDRTVVAGIPARKICTTDEYAEKCRQKMPAEFSAQKYKENKKKYLIETL